MITRTDPVISVKKSENSFLIDVLCFNCLYFIENSYLCSDLGVFLTDVRYA